MNKIISNFKNNKELYSIALNLGLTGFGGLAIVDRIKEEYVTKRKIISEQKFLHALSLAQILPGSTIINLIAFFNYLSAGLIGALIGTAIYILPTFLITTLFSVIYFRYPHEQSINKIVLSEYRRKIFGINIKIKISQITPTAQSHPIVALLYPCSFR